ncbi:MAG: hypothetical protein JWP20_1190 [Roseomonas sp.]|nr:hypothetical protein [Roseomonas sp.]
MRVPSLHVPSLRRVTAVPALVLMAGALSGCCNPHLWGSCGPGPGDGYGRAGPGHGGGHGGGHGYYGGGGGRGGWR